MRIHIFFASYHHNNTRKAVNYVEKYLTEAGHDVHLYDFTNEIPQIDGESDMTIYASGIYKDEIHENLVEFIDSLDDRMDKPAFFFYTAGHVKPSVAKKTTELLRAQSYDLLGTMGIPGYDTYGILKALGGINKGRPNEDDLKDLIQSLYLSMEHILNKEPKIDSDDEQRDQES